MLNPQLQNVCEGQLLTELSVKALYGYFSKLGSLFKSHMIIVRHPCKQDKKKDPKLENYHYS